MIAVSPWAQDACLIIAALGSAAAVVIGALNNRKLNTNTEVTRDTNKLVNGAHQADLHLAATTLRRIAVLTNEPGDIKAADEAKRVAEAHARQWTPVSTP